MAYGGYETAGMAARRHRAIKILLAGGFGVGKTTLVGAVSEIRPLRTEEPLTESGARTSTARRRGAQDHHHGGDGLRPDHAARGPGALPVRHARPGAVLVHVGRARARRARRGRARRHPAARRLLSRDRLLRAPRHPVHRRPQLSSRARAGTRADDVRVALDLDPGLPIVMCDARSKESAKEVLITLVEHVLVGGRRAGVRAQVSRRNERGLTGTGSSAGRPRRPCRGPRWATSPRRS